MSLKDFMRAMKTTAGLQSQRITQKGFIHFQDSQTKVQISERAHNRPSDLYVEPRIQRGGLFILMRIKGDSPHAS